MLLSTLKKQKRKFSVFVLCSDTHQARVPHAPSRVFTCLLIKVATENDLRSGRFSSCSPVENGSTFVILQVPTSKGQVTQIAHSERSSLFSVEDKIYCQVTTRLPKPQRKTNKRDVDFYKVVKLKCLHITKKKGKNVRK